MKELEDLELEKYKNNVQDNVRLGESGWKDRYYQDKLKMIDFEKGNFYLFIFLIYYKFFFFEGGGKEILCKSYVEGLCWVMLYYYKGLL